jgi:hypothetical protein
MAKLLRHRFTDALLDILKIHFGEDAERIYEASPLLQYINTKTRSASSGSKSRGSFANHYALYIVIEDYIAKGYFDPASSKSYSEYEGARYTDLLNRQRELPFGSKLQNHGLNSRLNDEFRKYFPSLAIQPIIRDLETQRYWIHEDLLRVTTRDKAGHDVTYNLAHVIIEIIDAYVASKRAAFETFIQACKDIAELTESDQGAAVQFIESQLQPNVDARVFEIVSYAILKTKYGQETIWIGDERDDVTEKFLVLYKTGRTNANDGGIDFVMKPLGRFFQVTETIDAGKYFLDIDKVQRFPMTFVVKSDLDVSKIFALVEAQARLRYKAESIVAAYMNCIEEIINTPILLQQFQMIVDNGKTSEIINEVILQSKLEFNFTSDMDGAVD